MDQISLSSALVVGLGATVFSLLLIYIAGLRLNARTALVPLPIEIEEEKAVFLFDGSILLDATPSARAILRASDSPNPDKVTIARMLEGRFPGLHDCLMNQNTTTRLISSASGSGTMARVDPVGDGLRLTLIGKDKSQQAIHPTTIQVMEDEISVLRGISQHAPQLIWQLNKGGTVVWANTAYVSLADQIRSLPLGIGSDWPPAALFEDCLDLTPSVEPATRRQKLRVPNQDVDRWFDVTSAKVLDGSVHFAVDAQTTVAAERQARVFVQTLSKTFAQLSAGLAIFDRSRKLVMFNPALMDLTKLSATFLSAQPDLSTLLDRLRDGGMLPEPKDYLSWREQVAALETKAEKGTYRDTWTLPGGETYRVSGRPHPDGALAFLIEDISAEISLTRMFRAELETTHAVIDSMDEGIAVFSAAGTLIINNAAYNTIWGTNSADLTGSNLVREMDGWRGRTIPTPFWDSLRRFCVPTANREHLSETIHLQDGRRFACRVVPLVSGSTLVGFKMHAATRSAQARPQPIKAPRQDLKQSQPI